MTVEDFVSRLEGVRVSGNSGNEWKARCPAHDDKTPSLSIGEGLDGRILVKCWTGCETQAVLSALGLSEKDLFASNNGQAPVSATNCKKQRARIASDSPEQGAPLSQPAFDWDACTAAFTEKDVDQVAQWRGYSPDFVRWLHDQKKIGLYRGRRIAFPVHDENGRIVGAHYKVGKDWFYAPKGTKTCPFLIGEPVPGEPMHCFESQWDGLAFMDVSGERSGIVITRGASNGGLVAGLIPPDSTIFCWTQNDQPDPKTRKIPAEEWQKDVRANLDGTVKRVSIPSQFEDLNAWTRDGGATAGDLITAMIAAEIVQRITLIKFKSPLELKNFVPPPGIILVGDCHITQGTVFVIAGAPGVGKSRALVALGVAGATEDEWFGLPVHRRFKTMIVQTENGQFRLSKEFSELDCEALEDYVRVCTPPPYGLCFKREDFRKQLADAISEFKPDIVGFDPWNAAAREQDSREYLDTFDALKSVLPRGDDAPVLAIVAHTRKPKSDERHNGRSLLNLLAGSYVLGSVPRAVFVMQSATDDVNDNRVVLTCCKNNDGELGDRSAWQRRNGLFAPIEFFDWDAFDHPPKEKRGLKPETLREFLMKGREYDKGQIVSIIMDETGRGKTVAYDLVDEAKIAGVLRHHKLTKLYELT